MSPQLLTLQIHHLVPAPFIQALRPGAATTLDVETLEAVAGDAPSATLPRDQVAGVTLAELMVTTKLQPSKGAARK